ncbi:hypothetical protein VC83_06543 [Pseudogymnoascus destructans]|uniref:Uncharacterized protein n=1 Tax=Pseudogymnoascus destructans TaxID=655981 RepID=A0A177A8E7_9PEZI|nr:uncharacterized protein VC83_06543 [Pseudogymnoascus destructans]OAF58417.1 hypothetical protein VC83_06543 [Pseudogymnoascus destructans]
MSAAVLLSQLKGLLDKTEHLNGKFSKVYPTGDQWDTLSNLSSRLSEAAKTVQEEIRVLLESRSDRAWKESEEHRSKAQSCRGDLFAKGRLKQPAVFRRNIVTIFKGPKTSTFDSEDIKFKNESTLKRCELIRGLSPDGVISWAMAFAPTLWAGGSISADIFTCLLDDIEPELVQTWPQVIRDTLHKLMEDEESLKKSPEYQEFLQALDDQSRKPVKNRKRRRTEDEIEQVKSATEDALSPSNESREMKYMYTNAPASNISNLPEPFRTAVENSRLWKWERSQELVTTGCLANWWCSSPDEEEVREFGNEIIAYTMNK